MVKSMDGLSCVIEIYVFGPGASAWSLTLLSFCFAKKKVTKKKAIEKIALPHRGYASCRFSKARLPAYVIQQ